jgi:hypothetical protein
MMDVKEIQVVQGDVVEGQLRQALEAVGSCEYCTIMRRRRICKKNEPFSISGLARLSPLSSTCREVDRSKRHISELRNNSSVRSLINPGNDLQIHFK